MGRHVAYYRSSHRPLTLVRGPLALESVFDAARRVGTATPAATEDQRRLVALLEQHLETTPQDRLRSACDRLGAVVDRVDLGTWRRAVELSACRAGLVLAGSFDGAEWMLRWVGGARHVPIDDATDDLLRFWSSGAHVRVRHLLRAG